MDVEFGSLLEEKKATIFHKWFDAIMETYPIDTSGFLKEQKDRFRNLAGHTFTEGIDKIVEELIKGNGFTEELPFLDDIIWVRAIQDDELALNTFNIYVKCREQLYELRTDELKRMTFTLLKKANLMSELSMEEFEHKDPNLIKINENGSDTRNKGILILSA